MFSSKFAATGTLTAKTDDPELPLFDGVRLFLIPGKHWIITAEQALPGFPNEFRNISFYVPDESVTDKTFDFSSSSSGALGNWYKSTPSTVDAPYRAFEGQLTLTLDTEKETARGTFRFKGTSPNGKQINLSEGEFNLKADSKNMVASGDVSEGAINANVLLPETGEVFSYRSTGVNLTTQENDPNLGPKSVAWSEYWSGRPDHHNQRLLFHVSEKVKTNTAYDFATDKNLVTGMFMNLKFGIQPYPATAGSITFRTLPTPGTEKIEATFHFRGTASDGSTAEITAGDMSIENP
ncbi:hypothetical protein [Pseudomonas sp. KCJK9016]|uniref:hypothetical protein n=1 Tax=Pseudomonas sp. KCJK9016 TaxID=3344556 RepID=UPI003905E07C